MGEPRAKMFIVYMLPYYIEVLYYVSIEKVLKCGMCWCVLRSYLVVRCVLVTYSRRIPWGYEHIFPSSYAIYRL